MTDKKEMAIWAANCAAHVLPIFTEAQPDDERPRLAIEAARSWARGEIKVGKARAAALDSHAAARECANAAASAAARSAGHAAATAHMAGHAAHAAKYAVKAAYAASASISASEERSWQHGLQDAALNAGKNSETVFSIREATEEDYPAIVRLSTEWEQEGITYGYVADTLENVRRFRCWCILGPAGAVGYLIGEKKTSSDMSTVPDGSIYFKVWDLYIACEYRSHGLGRLLIGHVECQVKSEGIEYMILSSSTRDAAKIQKFYTQNAGFTIFETTFFKKI